MIKAILLVMIFAGAAAGDALREPLRLAGDNSEQIQGFVATAGEQHGAFGTRAAEFLVQGMPERDLRTLRQDFLTENLNLAMQVRDQFPWGKSVPDDIFLNDVLPYASLDETREPWRRKFLQVASAMVADCQTTSEAAQALNQKFFNVVKVHYNRGRKRANQSPSESEALGMATCTGLSIILVDACRAVGVPARVTGIASWANKRGNHTWVEIWDDGNWRFAGADEYDPQGLDRGWFTGDASKAQADDWRHAIWSTSWRTTDAHFPMVWNRFSRSVPAVNVTSRYGRTQARPSEATTVHFRVFDKPGGERLVVTVELFDEAGKSLGRVETKAGGADLNDMPALALPPDRTYVVTLQRDGQRLSTKLKVDATTEMTAEWNWVRLLQAAPSENSSAETPTTETPTATGSANLAALGEWLQLPAEERKGVPPSAPLSRAEADAATQMIWRTLRNEQTAERQKELDQKIVKAAGKQMKYLEKTFGDAPEGEKSLWISMHGGGGAPPRVNERQWRNQIRLYKPEEGIVVAPRAPTDNWNLWHEAHIDPLFARLIENYVTLRGVSPNRVYLIGYSAGGDGVYQLAPRMADRFAAAAMMAGHPNDASPVGLRNLPFMIFMGGDDRAYNRNKVAAEWGAKLDELQKSDPRGYEHKVTIYPGLGHWMQGKDAEALPWMAAHTRQAWPKTAVWRQSGVTHDRFYWLAAAKDAAQAGQVVRAEVKGQRIEVQVEGDLIPIELRLDDALLDLDEPIEVTLNDKPAFSGKVKRSAEAIYRSLNQRMDREAVASSLLQLGQP